MNTGGMSLGSEGLQKYELTVRIEIEDEDEFEYDLVWRMGKDSNSDPTWVRDSRFTRSTQKALRQILESRSECRRCRAKLYGANL
jgi:hypothetical protein